ncbi:MAG: hypothetical protein KDE47_00050 [Caldilineaceae bacterium]|nr:hypothetical protein [Caldilineaceae bacterium]MCB9149466.1 antitoxin [Caldilineaceae bacterium]
MQSKLTLRLEESLIEEAKVYAREQGKSLSQIVADYFRALTLQRKNTSTDAKSEIELGPVTASLLGAFADVTVDDYKSLREEYIDYLEAKHS